MSLTLLCLIVVGGYIAFFQVFHPQNHFTMTSPPFYQNVKLGPNPTFYYQPPSPHVRLFLISQGTENFWEKAELFLRTKSKTKYQVGTKYHLLRMSKVLLSSFRTAVLLTLFFNLILFSCLLVFSLLFSNNTICREITQFYF